MPHVPIPTPLRGLYTFTSYLREKNISFDFPLNQVSTLIAVYEAGSEGATYEDISRALGGLSPGSVSKNVARLSLAHTMGDRPKGFQFLRISLDPVRRRYYRVHLTEDGLELVNVLIACLTGEFTRPTDLPGAIPDETFAPDPKHRPTGKEFKKP